jgi:enoyl-CoA hydratase
MIDAQEAHRIGLVNRVVPQADLLSVCIEIAQTTARNSPSSMAITKSLINETLNLPEEKAWVINDRYMRASFETDDFMEGPRAYVERRDKQFVRS